MRKFLKACLIIGLILIVFIFAANKLNLFAAYEISEQEIANYSNYYFDKLSIEQQKNYIRIDKAIQEKSDTIVLGQQDVESLNEEISTVLTAYFYDNPQIYHVSNEYTIVVRDFEIFKQVTLKLDYTIDDLETKNQELEQAITEMLNSVVKSGMSDFEKELAIHDALVKRVEYYQYEDISSIPQIKHTAYGALVEREAVCDGYSKAFKILLERVGIESVIVSGKTNDVAHAWNLVKLDEEWYNVDVTSDNIAHESNRYVIHTYFNLTDAEISKTHILGDTFTKPTCDSEDYNYYKYMGLYLEYEDNLYTKLDEIISNENNDSKILEIKADSRYNVQSIIDTLYDLNFNNWRSSGKTKISYNKVEDVYMFVK